MESLITQFNFLSDQSLNDKNLDPSTIEDLVKLFEIESYKAWAAMELEHETQVQKAESAMGDAEEYLDLTMESAMEEFRRFEEEMERESREQLRGLVQVAEKARRMGNSIEKAASFASKKYIEAALNSAGASMKSAVKAVTSNSKKDELQKISTGFDEKADNLVRILRDLTTVQGKIADLQVELQGRKKYIIGGQECCPSDTCECNGKEG